MRGGGGKEGQVKDRGGGSCFEYAHEPVIDTSGACKKKWCLVSVEVHMTM
jgi:hypothetical protein